MTSIRGLPPRVAIRNRDFATGSYPSNVRTGDDSRTGKYSVFYNDVNTEIFNEEKSLGELFLSGSSADSLIEDPVLPIPGESVTPFNESFRPEQSQSGKFFQTGSNVSEVGLGFSSKLASKTQIRFSFDVESLYTANAQSASMAYYNKDLKRFELVGGNEALTDPGKNTESGMLGRDCKLFNAIGMALMSGTGTPGVFTSAPSPYHGFDSAYSEVIDRALAYVQPQTLTLNQKFNATGSQLIPLSGVLGSPFLLEKAIIELNISSSNGWFDDFTRSIQDVGGARASDLGGPCVTVCLMNQIGKSSEDVLTSSNGDYTIFRELILSSTIIPVTDSGSFAYVGDTSIGMPAGFLSFATPGAIVSDMGIQRVQLNADAAISNGILILGTFGDSFQGSRLGEISPFCRSLNPNQPSGKSFFGKEFTSPSLKNAASFIKYDRERFEEENPSISFGNIFQYELGARSPYLLTPKDNLILGVSKYRAVRNVPESSQTVTASHEFGIPPGRIDITLYGSLIREDKEFHDTLNQLLTSDAVHEYVHYDNPVIDQFDVEPKSSFTGSYVTEFFTGSIFNEDVGLKRAIRTSLIGISNTVTDITTIANFRISTPAFNRFIQLKSDNERYYDTLVPKIDEMVKIEGADIMRATNSNQLLLGKDEIGYPSASFFESWYLLFPFEAKFASVVRTVSPFNETVSTIDNVGNPVSIYSNNLTVIKGGDFLFGYNESRTAILDNVADSVLLKAVFGFGDGDENSPILNTIDKSVEIFNLDASIRGFKYGLHNCLPRFRKNIFRRDRFGQFRDMIEQSKDSKIFDVEKFSQISSPVLVRFIGSDGNPTDGENTFSSNVSTAATSSYPYFDDISRNRGDLPSVEIVP